MGTEEGQAGVAFSTTRKGKEWGKPASEFGFGYVTRERGRIISGLTSSFPLPSFILNVLIEI